MISNIGFRNFRKFKDFPAIDLGGVTILVGENNSGKSTFTKASLLLANFLKMNLFSNIQNSEKQIIGASDYSKEFSFKDERFRHIYVDTFFQALCNKSDSGEIEFSCSLEDFDITVTVMVPKAFTREQDEYAKILDQCQKEAESNGEDANYIFSKSDFSIYYPQIRQELPNYYKQELDVDTAIVSKLKIYDNSNGFSIEIDYDLFETRCTMDGLNRNEKARLDELMVALSKLTPEDNAYDSVTKEIDELERKRNEKKVQWNGALTIYKGSSDCITSFIKSIAKGSFMRISRKLTAEEKLQYSYAGLDSMNRLTNLLNHNKEEYIYAHSVHQLSSYHFENGSQNDYVDKTISEYFIYRTDRHDDRVRKWMSSFGIGDDFKIEKDLNGCLTIEIFDKDDVQSLSAKGIGSIQLMIMFFKLSMIVENDPEHTTVIIEEPEQNLHPALQSRLAELFHSIYCEYGCQFIVETHSEYLVRKSQVIVAENKNSKQNPFKVYYFVKDGLPYEIRYDQDGQFLDVFGTGFFDTAETLNLDRIQKHYGK